MHWTIWERQWNNAWEPIESELTHSEAIESIEFRSLCDRRPGQGSLVALPAGEKPVGAARNR